METAGATVIEVDALDERHLGPALASLAGIGITGELILLVVGPDAPLPALDALARVAVWRRGGTARDELGEGDDTSLSGGGCSGGGCSGGGCSGGGCSGGGCSGSGCALAEALERQLDRRRQRRVPGIDRDPRWVVSLPEGAGTERLAASLGALANGRVGVRALDGLSGRVAPSFLVAGVYDTEDRLLPGPVWTAVDIPEDPEPAASERLVDLRSGLLWCRTIDGVGPSSMCFVSVSDPHVMGLRFETPDGRTGVAEGPVLRAPGDGYGFSVERAPGSEVASTAAGNDMDAAGDGIVVHGCERRTAVGDGLALERLAVWAVTAGGQPVTAGGPADRLASAERAGFDRLLAAHRAAWAARWDHVGVRIDGSPEDELAARFAVFHLLGAAADRGESAVGPRGLTGDAYAGHVFWDADVFVLPALAAIRPAAARSMLQYRIDRLPAARRTAASAGRRGARFPWESARDGTDVTPHWVRDHSGQVVPIRTGRHEIHIVSDVAWAAWTYAEWSGDEQFLSDGPGRDLLLETARYWASRIRVDRTGRGHLYGVMGPDEYHQVVDDNAFTNVMARWNLRSAAMLAGRDTPTGSRAGEEAAAWLALASRLVDGWDNRRHTFEQFAGYYRLEGLMVRDIAEPPVAIDLVIPPERVAGSQLIKQADTLMLHHMVPDEVPPGSLGPTLDYYGPRTAHGSSLSPAVHASLLARAGRTDDALSMFRLAARLDLDDVTGTTHGGLHLATMGGVWQALAYGFLGLRADSGALRVDPQLPSDWSALTLRFFFRGVPVEVRADHRRVSVACEAPIQVRVWSGRAVTVRPPGRTWSRSQDPEGLRSGGDVGPC